MYYDQDIMGQITDSDNIKLLKKTFLILDLFSIELPHWSFADLVNRTQIPKGMLIKIIKTLLDNEYLNFNGSQYELGLAAVDIGQRATVNFDIGKFSQTIIEELAALTKDTVLLTKLNKCGLRCVTLRQIPSVKTGLLFYETMGATAPLNSGASAKAILSTLSVEQQNKFYQQPLMQFSSNIIIDVDLLKQDIMHIQKRGYAVSKSEVYDGMIGISAAYKDNDDRSVGSICIAAPLYRFSDKKIVRYGKLVKQAADKLSAEIKRN